MEEGDEVCTSPTEIRQSWLRQYIIVVSVLLDVWSFCISPQPKLACEKLDVRTDWVLWCTVLQLQKNTAPRGWDCSQKSEDMGWWTSLDRDWCSFNIGPENMGERNDREPRGPCKQMKGQEVAVSTGRGRMFEVGIGSSFKAQHKSYFLWKAKLPPLNSYSLTNIILWTAFQQSCFTHGCISPTNVYIHTHSKAQTINTFKWLK